MITMYEWKLLIRHYWKIKKVNGPEKWTDLDYVGIDFNLDSYLVEIKRYQDRFKIKTCYSAEYNGKSYETLEIDWVGSQAKKKMMLSAGIHGNEIAGILAIPRVMQDISQNPEYYKDWEIKIITPVNPVGASFLSRYNKDGYDINRDFRKDEYKTQEARKLVEIFSSFKPDMVVDMHEASQPKGLIILANHSSSEEKTHELAKRLDGKIELAERHYMKTKLEVKGLEREGWFVIILERIFGANNLQQVADDQRITSLTLESPWPEKDKEKRIVPHVVAFKEIVDVFK